MWKGSYPASVVVCVRSLSFDSPLEGDVTSRMFPRPRKSPFPSRKSLFGSDEIIDLYLDRVVDTVTSQEFVPGILEIVTFLIDSASFNPTCLDISIRKIINARLHDEDSFFMYCFIPFS